MKVSRAQAELNRAEVVRVAARKFRQGGIEGTSVADIFGEVGLTHGAMYVQFPGGKETLAAEAIGQAFAERRDAWNELAASNSPEKALQDIIDSYLSAQHRDDPGAGCPTSLMGAEAERRGGAVRTAYTDGLNELVASLSQVAPGESDGERRKVSINMLSKMLGAMLISRAVDDAEFSDEILAAIDFSTAP